MRKKVSESTRYSHSELVNLAKDHLISQQHCTTTKDHEHTVACFGYDLNGLDYARRWLYEKELKASHDVEDARIKANKVVLFVNAEELNREIQRLRSMCN